MRRKIEGRMRTNGKESFERRKKKGFSFFLSFRFKACNEWPLTTEWRKKPFEKTEKWEREKIGREAERKVGG